MGREPCDDAGVGARAHPLRPSQSRSLLYVTIGALAFLAVRPIGVAERALDLALAPTRWLAELAGPLGWLQSRDVHAADPARRARAADELALRDELERMVLEMAAPSPALAATLAERGVGTMRAEVVERPRELDRIVLRVEDPARVRHGLPVVCGDGFVGTVDTVTPLSRERPRDHVEVALITGRDARIGGLVAADDAGRRCELVVGGLSPAAEVRLDIHNPSDRARRTGLVRVWEPDPTEPLTRLANDFVLGALAVDPVEERDPVPGVPPRTVPGLRPALDYRAGLYQVLVLLPPGEPRPKPPAAGDGFGDGRWRPVRLALRAEPSPWRRGRKLIGGARDGIEVGAALASGVRFYGRVSRVGATTADVMLLADRGFRVPVLARVEHPDGARPHVMGELVSLGDASGRLLLRWRATVPFHDAFPQPATLWTGSGARGVPRGLLLGSTTIPPGPGPHVLALEPPPGGVEPARLVVRVDERPAPEGAP